MENRKCYIYVLKDPITKEVRYVGKTLNIRNRLRQHIFYALYPRTHTECWVKSIVIRNLLPIMEIVACVNEDKWEETEKKFIKYYKDKGYNLTNIAEGGNGNNLCYASPEMRKNWILKLKKTYSYKVYTKEEKLIRAENARLTHLGRKRSLITRERLSQTKKGKLNPMYGKHLSDEVRKKISIANKGRKINEICLKEIRLRAIKSRKPVIQLDLSGKIIRIFNSIKLASEETRCERSNIIACCKGRLRKTCGYIWKYKNGK